MATKKKIVIIGSGFAGLSAAGLLARDGYDVTILEKNDQPGGRARVWEKDGFVFDMGPSWYWMPEVFENYYNLFGKTTADFYRLIRLDPSYRIFHTQNEKLDVPASHKKLVDIFEEREPGSGTRLQSFLHHAEKKYNTAMTDYVHRLSHSVTEFMEPSLIAKSLQLKIFQSLRKEVRGLFSDPLLVSMLEFPVLFLGSTPDKTPSLYSMMNYADLVLGTWYPMGGMNQIVQAMVKIATGNGARLMLNHEVKRIETQTGKAKHVHTDSGVFEADVVIAGSDYHHTEQKLLREDSRVYNNEYWNSRTMSPSSLLFFVGVNRRVEGLLHHNLFFDADFELHANQIYNKPQWPTAPLFYACAPSKTDNTVAPDGMENIFLLMPIAPGIKDTDEMREKYYHMMMERLEQRAGQAVRPHVVVKRSYCVNDFEADYHSFKGNAYGLANTLMQTAFMKPKMRSEKVKNLFYTGQLTVPGPGVPPAIISGQIAAREVSRQIEKQLI